MSPEDPMTMERGAPEGRERRRHVRVSGDWPIRVTLDTGVHEARLRDVSRAGLCFYMEQPIPMMTVLRVALDLPGPDRTRSIVCEGAVVRSQRISAGVDHWEIAVFLQEISDRHVRDLEAFLETQGAATG